MPTKKWSEEEEDFLKDNYMDLSNSDLADKFHITKNAVQKKLARMGLKRSELSDDLLEDDYDDDEEDDDEESEEQSLASMESHFYQGNKFYFEDQDFNRAVSEYIKAIENDSDESIKLKARYWLAESYVKLQKIDKAKKIFKVLAEGYRQHYLGGSAGRRLKELEDYIVPGI